MKTVTNVIPIDEIFSDVTLIGQTPNLILKTQLPDKIFEEVKGWIEPCREIKDDDYRELLNHRNVGTGHNSYQTAVPRRLLDNSFFLGYVCHFGELYLNTVNTGQPNQNLMGRRVHLRNYPGHFDGYDCWVNFTYKGDDNPEHNHAGSLSSIIYIQDEDCQPTNFPTLNYVHHPKEGEILLFPSNLWHSVDVKETESERISASFNLDVFC
jgi:hypothetical protein